MEAAFWLERWENGQTGWHSDSVHPGLMAHREALGEPRRVLVPLCGASLDVGWLAEQLSVDEVVGIDLSPLAAARLFDEAGLSPHREERGAHTWWRAPGISVCVGDFFSAVPADVGAIDAVWDRAAMIAIDPARRLEYAQKLSSLAPGAPLLLNALVYDQALHDGPPWCLGSDEVRRLFGAIDTLTVTDVLDERWRERGHSWIRTELHLARL